MWHNVDGIWNKCVAETIVLLLGNLATRIVVNKRR